MTSPALSGPLRSSLRWCNAECIHVAICIVLHFLFGTTVSFLPAISNSLCMCSHDNPAVELSTPYRQLHWLYLVSVNLWLLICPSWLCADWTMATIPLLSSLSDTRHLATLLCLAAILILGTYSLTGNTRRAKTVLFALCLMVFPFLPASNLFFPVGFVVAERVLYLPSMGFSLLVACGVWTLPQSGRSLPQSGRCLVATGLALTIGMHSLKTVVRNADWNSDQTLFQSAISINPANGKLYNNLGHSYEQSKNFSYAERLFSFASNVQPDDVGAFINVGRMMKQLGRPQEAEEVINSNNNSYKHYNNKNNYNRNK